MLQISLPRGIIAFSIGTLACFAGCGSGLERKPTAAVSGTITCHGSPVESLILFFEPTGKGDVGRQGTAVTDANGNFTVTTYVDGDGAVLGSHRVHALPSDKEGWSCDCNTNVTVKEVDVVEGDNVFNLELPAKPKKAGKDLGNGWDEED